MKFNLKNRPEIVALFDSSQKELEEWFEGFEKEFQNMLDQHAWTTTMVRNIQVKKNTLWIEVSEVKKEVLGE